MTGRQQRWSKRLRSVGITFHPDVLKAVDKERKKGAEESRGKFVNRIMAEVLGVKLK